MKHLAKLLFVTLVLSSVLYAGQVFTKPAAQPASVNQVVSVLYDGNDIIDRYSLSFEDASANKAAVKSALAQKAGSRTSDELAELNWEIYRRGYKHLLTHEENLFIVDEVSKVRYNNLSDEEKSYYDDAD